MKIQTVFGWLATAIAPWALTVCTNSGGDPEVGTEPLGVHNEWDWFVDTYWIVPQDGIYSVVQNAADNTFGVLRGQTVFHLTDYFNGYFTGVVGVKVGPAPSPSCQFVLGQITPQGDVTMGMYNASDGTLTNQPLGEMVMRDEAWTMVNRMSAPTGSGTLNHWAYMVQSAPGDETWDSLPFSENSVPDFLSACPPGPMIDRSGASN